MNNSKKYDRDMHIVWELEDAILKTAVSFKSSSHPRANITDLHFVKALARLLAERTRKLK